MYVCVCMYGRPGGSLRRWATGCKCEVRSTLLRLLGSNAQGNITQLLRIICSIMYTCRCLHVLAYPGNIGCHRFTGTHAVHELLSHDCQNRAFEGNTRFHQPPPQDVFQRGLLQLHLIQFLLAIQHILRLSVPLSSLRLCVVCSHRDSSVVRVLYVCMH